MSRNKCRICGYRFKSDDEIICPECFTARDEDISCNSLSDDLHSHDLRADNVNAPACGFGLCDFNNPVKRSAVEVGHVD